MKLAAMIIIVLVASLSQAATFGELVLGGGGCVNKTSTLEVISASQSTYAIPLNLYVKKEETTALDRKACTLAMPVTLAANEKLVIEETSQSLNMRVHPGGDAKAQLEVFLAGQKGEVLKTEATATDKYLSSRQTLAQNGVIAESACGQDTIVRANVSGIATGNSKVRIYTEKLKLTLKVVSCN